MTAAKPRSALSAGLIPPKHTSNAASVSEAKMTLAPTAPAPVEQPAPATAKVVEEPAGENPVNNEPAPKPAAPKVQEQVAEPKQPAAPVVEPEPKPEPPVVVIRSAQPAAMPEPAELPQVIITAPRHARSVDSATQQLSCKVGGDRLERYLEAKFRLRLSGQDIITEALDIWLAHNGF
jgi:hypothetical protein